MAKAMVRLKRWWQAAEWPIVWTLAVVAIALGVAGYSQHFALANQPRRTLLDLFYLSLQLFVLQSGFVAARIPLALEVARLLAPAVAVYTASQAFLVLFRDQFRRLRLHRSHNHIVICGAGTKGALLASGFTRRGDRVIVIDRDGSNQRLERCREQGAIAITANATDLSVLRQARVDKARCVLAVCGDDSVNAEIALRAREAAGRRRPPLTCFVHIVEPRLCNLLRERRIATIDDDFRLEFFNVFESGAADFLSDIPADTIRHLVLVGVSRMGENILVRAARDRSLQDHGRDRLRATIVDHVATKKIESLNARYPRLAEICDVRGLDLDVQSPEFERGDFLRDANGHVQGDVVCVCLDDDARGLAAALALTRHVEGTNVPIVVRVQEHTGLAALIDSDAGGANLHVFGLLDRTLNPELLESGLTETLARAIQADYVNDQKQRGATPATNPSMADWMSLPESLKESNRRQADHVSVKLGDIGCSVVPFPDWGDDRFELSADEIEQVAQLEHERWSEDRKAEGWKYAPGKKNPSRKTHPCLTEWNQLPEEVKELDRNVARSLPTLLSRVGFRIVRVASAARQSRAV